MDSKKNDRILGIVVGVFAAILLIGGYLVSTRGIDFPDLFVQAYITALLGLLIWVSTTLSRFRLGERISSTVLVIFIMIFFMLIGNDAAPDLHLQIFFVVFIGLVLVFSLVFYYERKRKKAEE